VQIDEAWKDMPEGFPTDPEKRGDDYVIKVRLPRFNSTAFYDPIMDANDEVATSDDTTSGGASIVPLSLGLLLGFVAFKLAF